MVAGVLLRACCLAGMIASMAPASAREEANSPASRTASAADRRLPASLPLRTEPSVPGPAWAPALAWLGLASVAGGLWWWLRTAKRSLRGRADASAQGIVRLSSQALTPQASVHAVRWNGEDYLLACTAQGVSVVSRRQAPSASEQA